MTLVVDLLAWLNGLAFALLGVAAARSWVRARTPQWGALALAMGAFGLCAALGRISPLLGYPAPLDEISTVAFLFSGWALLRFRHSVIPYSATTMRVAVALLSVSGAAVLAADLPGRPGVVPLTSLQLASVAALIAVWSGCVGEPAFRFWREASGRPLVQRRRLRSLSVGFGGLIVVLASAIAVGPRGLAPASRIVFQSAVLLLVPVLFAALSPPAWLRRRWRRHEHAAMRAAIENIVEAADEQLLGAQGLDWAMRLLGGDTGFVALGNRVLAAQGLHLEDMDALLEACRKRGIYQVASLDGRHAVVVPLAAGDDRGTLAVVSGPFSPVFGSDELRTLEDLAVPIARSIERLHLMEAVRQQSARYEALLTAISDLGQSVTITRDGRIVFVNDAACSMMGYAREQLLAMESWPSMIPVEERQQVADQLVALFTGQPGSEQWSCSIIRGDGARRKLEGSAKLLEIDGQTHVLTIARDVTDRARAAERDRRRSEQLAALALHSQRLASSRELDGLLPILAEAAAEVGRCAEAAACAIEPGQPAVWFGPDGSTVPPVEASSVLEMLATELRPIRTSFSAGKLHGPGQIREVLAVPIVRSGRLTGAILMRAPEAERFDEIDEAVSIGLAACAAEVLESARALARERSMTRRLKELDEVKNSFLAAVSHELRTPLTSVLGFAHTLQRSGERLTVEERAAIVTRLAVNAEKLERLLADLLDLDRLNRGIVEPVVRTIDLGGLVLRAVETFDFPDARPVHVEVESLEASVDAPKIERIIENLLSNAVRHTTADTPIWVKARREDGGVALLIEDAGPGVPEHLRAMIFEPFQQASRRPHSPGVGIGLSLVARFAEMHGGRAWVTDRAGGGASFRVWLPLARAEQRSAAIAR